MATPGNYKGPFLNDVSQIWTIFDSPSHVISHAHMPRPYVLCQEMFLVLFSCAKLRNAKLLLLLPRLKGEIISEQKRLTILIP